LTHQAATNGLPPVSWHRAGVSKGNLPVWVAAELERAASIAHAAHCSFTSSGPRSDSAPKGLRPPDRASRDRDQTRRPDHRGQRPPGPMRLRAPRPRRVQRSRTGLGAGWWRDDR
jgi:hypothetical protein